MAKLILTRGLPASGKSTRAVAWVQSAPDGERRARLNRDDLRASVFVGSGVLPFDVEQAITRIQHATARDLLGSGVSVVVDDMNLRQKWCREWADLAAEVGAELEVWDFTDVPVVECVARDAARAAAGGRGVGEKVIRDIHARYLASGPLTPVTPTRSAARVAVQPYVGDSSLPPAWIVDMDGTLAVMGDRSPFDWHRVGEDAVNDPVCELIDALCLAGSIIVVMSGRDEVCRAETEAWLTKYQVPWHDLFMRPEGDTRKDAVVKAELFDRHVRGVYDVRGVIDDRRQVVDFWRSLGLMCAQVAPGNF